MGFFTGKNHFTSSPTPAPDPNPGDLGFSELKLGEINVTELQALLLSIRKCITSIHCVTHQALESIS